MKITTAWTETPRGPVLLGAYLGGGPSPARRVGTLIRDLVLNVPDSAIESLFAAPEVEVTTGEGDPLPEAPCWACRGAKWINVVRQHNGANFYVHERCETCDGTGEAP